VTDKMNQVLNPQKGKQKALPLNNRILADNVLK
jgi:hypothetical protein